MDVTSLGYRTDLALLRAGGSTVEDRGDHLVVRSPHTPTYWWGNFVLVRAPRAQWTADRWLPVFAAAFPDAGHVALGFDDPDAGPGDVAGFAGHGLRVEAMTVLTATTVHAPPRPNREATVRALAGDDDWAQHVELRMALREEAFEPAAHREFVTARMRTTRSLVEAGGGAWFGAFLGGRLVAQLGLLSAGDGFARYQSVETDPQLRRQGLAGTLVHHAARYGVDTLGAATLVIVADPDDVAIRVYRSVGFVDTERQLEVDRAPA